MPYFPMTSNPGVSFLFSQMFDPPAPPAPAPQQVIIIIGPPGTTVTITQPQPAPHKFKEISPPHDYSVLLFLAMILIGSAMITVIYKQPKRPWLYFGILVPLFAAAMIAFVIYA
jgi:hypothetical protein